MIRALRSALSRSTYAPPVRSIEISCRARILARAVCFYRRVPGMPIRLLPEVFWSPR